MYPPPARPRGALESPAGARTVPTGAPAHRPDVLAMSGAQPGHGSARPVLAGVAVHGETPVRGLRRFTARRITRAVRRCFPNTPLARHPACGRAASALLL